MPARLGWLYLISGPRMPSSAGANWAARPDPRPRAGRARDWSARAGGRAEEEEEEESSWRHLQLAPGRRAGARRSPTQTSRPPMMDLVAAGSSGRRPRASRGCNINHAGRFVSAQCELGVQLLSPARIANKLLAGLSEPPCILISAHLNRAPGKQPCCTPLGPARRQLAATDLGANRVLEWSRLSKIMASICRRRQQSA